VPSTSDSREGTEQFLSRENLWQFVDLIVCGDDPESKPKPGLSFIVQSNDKLFRINLPKIYFLAK